MYAGRQYAVNVSTLERHAFECENCTHQAMAVIVGLGSGAGASPFFLDNKGAQQRAQVAARKDASLEIQRALATVACPKCGHVHRKGVRARRQRAVFTAIGFLAACVVVASLASSGSVVGLGIGFAVGLVAGVIAAVVVLSKVTPVVFESLPVQSPPRATPTTL